MADNTQFLTRLTENIAYVQQLGDNPNSDNGLTATALKAWFDKAPEAIKNYLNNTFIPEIENKVGSLDKWISEADVAIKNFSVGAGFLPTNGTVPMAGDLDIGSHKVVNMADPEEKTDAANKKYVDNAVGEAARIAQNNFTYAQNAANSAANAASKAQSTADGKAAVSAITVILSTTGWSSNKQAVSAAGVLADETKCHVILSPAESSREAYNDAVVRCTAQGAGTLTFACDDVPSADLTVNVLVVT